MQIKEVGLYTLSAAARKTILGLIGWLVDCFVGFLGRLVL
jgi:hypothetical protein